MLDQAKAERGAPEYIRMDNGPELIANAIRDWCRLSGTGTIYIEPGSTLRGYGLTRKPSSRHNR